MGDSGRIKAWQPSIFWKVAGILVGVQVATAALAVLFSARFAEERSLDLVTSSLRLRLDALAEEIEQRATVLNNGLDSLSRPLQIDLSYRFPDPVIVIDAQAVPIFYAFPGKHEWELADVRERVQLPQGLADTLASGNVIVNLPNGLHDSWGLAPLYDADGILTGGVLVQPLMGSVDRELANTRAAYRRALWVTGGLATLIALMLGAFFTWRLVRPIQGITHQVERIGAGDYTVRLDIESRDEFGRLASSVNKMAKAVESSIDTLKASDALRRELIANVGHDLRTPLAAMLGYLEESIHQLGRGDTGEAVRALEIAEGQGQFLKQLVGDLFELSLLDSAVPPLRREPVPMAELLTEAANAHRVPFRQAGIHFTVDIQGALPALYVDGVRMLRILDNLLVNARQHTPPGGAVALHARVAEDGLEVEVTDTGSGVKPHQLEHIFERYYRGDDARTRHRDGTGLGLPISRAIARAHGGDLTVESTPNEKTVFSLLLPFQGNNVDNLFEEA